MIHFFESEKDKCLGFKHVLNDIIAKQVLGLTNEKLAASILLDFEDYVGAVSKAQDKFFSETMVRSQSFSSLLQKGGSGARLAENTLAAGNIGSDKKQPPAFFSLAGGPGPEPAGI